jgi:hypothetical protein
MPGGGFFSFGDAAPFLLMFLGTVVIAPFSSAAAFAVRIRANSGHEEEELEPHIDWAIGILAISGLLSILGAILYHRTSQAGNGMLFVVAGMFFLWPLSFFLTVRGRGVGRSVLLAGQILIAVWMSIFLLVILAHR